MKKIFICSFVIIGCLFLINKIFSYSFAYEYEIDNSVLFYKDDYQQLEKDIEKYLGNIDDIIIPNSKFLYSDILVDNYDFLVYFAIDYVLNNKEYYYDSISSYGVCSYYDKYGIEKDTRDYINLEVIYDITDFYFGVRDFMIINSDVCINDNFISLSDYTSSKFNFNIKKVSISDNEDGIEALITYDNGDKYLYSFYNDNNVLKLKNVEVVV